MFYMNTCHAKQSFKRANVPAPNVYLFQHAWTLDPVWLTLKSCNFYAKFLIFLKVFSYKTLVLHKSRMLVFSKVRKAVNFSTVSVLIIYL